MDRYRDTAELRLRPVLPLEALVPGDHRNAAHRARRLNSAGLQPSRSKTSVRAGATRCGLARLLCELADWKDSKGRLALASARKVLPKVAAKAGLAGIRGGEIRRLRAQHAQLLEASAQRRQDVRLQRVGHGRIQRLVQAQEGLAAERVDPIARGRGQA